jgi:superfamily II DNA or RNA helicase
LSRFITNQNEFLKDVLDIYIPGSKQLDFLVGFFCFSGFLRIYHKIDDKKLRILVGMDADVDVHNALRESAAVDYGKSTPGLSREKVRSSYYKSFREVVSKADSLDTYESEKSFRFFIEKLKSGTLEVKKTKSPNHAKMYVFVSDDAHSFNGKEPGRVIVGSSNLSFQGLEGRTEVNVMLGGPDASDYVEAEDLFNKLWDEAVPLVDATNKDEFLENAVKHTWLYEYPAPYLMYIRVLYEYFKTNTETIKTPAGLTNTYINLAYQTDAICESIEKIEQHSGCIIADVVGLGKSIIAAAVAANLAMETVVICPPHLKEQWEELAYAFGLQRFKVISSGKLEDAVAAHADSEKLVIVDEAHRFRNENTLDYSLLHRICIGNKVMLLSATPFNNRPEDIFSLIKLFQIPAHSTIQVVNNLGAAMERLIVDYKKLKTKHREDVNSVEFKTQASAISSKIRAILQPVVIRRTRVDLLDDERYKEDLMKQNIVFSDVEAPEEQQYELGAMSQLYLETLKQLTGVEDSESKVFIGARYQTLTYLKDDKKIIEKYQKIFDSTNPQEGQRNLAVFMRRLLVRRFESSVYSFKKTLKNIIESMNNIKKWYCNFKKVPIFKRSSLPDFDSLEQMINEEMDGALFIENIDDILEQKLSPQIEKGLVIVQADELTEYFIRDLESDVALFEDILAKWESFGYDDPKFAGILAKIEDALEKESKRKIIIFSEFKDTVDYLEEQFKKHNLRVIKYTSKTSSNKNDIKCNFDAGYSEEKQKNDYDVLVATDAISEGFSLHRAGTIYNYDIPYNPTRVIQRVGRINRINKKVFDKLNIYNFFPSATGEALSHTKSISTFKMLLIQTIFGSDTKILTDEEIVEGYLTAEYKKAKAEADSPSWKIEFKNEFYRIERNEREALKEALKLPLRCRTGRRAPKAASLPSAGTADLFPNAGAKGVLVFSRKGADYRFTFVNGNGENVLLSPYEGVSLFKASSNEKALEVTKEFYPLYEQAKSFSGAVSERTGLSKNIVALNNKIMFMKKNLPADSGSIDYLENLRKTAVSLGALPLYYIKRLLDVDIKDVETAVAEFKNIVGRNYIDIIIKKDDSVLRNDEAIILAEQFID